MNYSYNYNILKSTGLVNLVENDIFDVFENDESSLKCLLHQANIFCCMGAGIAKQISIRYPKAAVADGKTGKGNKSKLGKSSHGWVNRSQVVSNLYGQATVGSANKRDTSYDAIYDAMENWFKENSKFEPHVLIPYGMSSDLAGARWPVIEKMIECLSETYKVKVTICKLPNKPYLI